MSKFHYKSSIPFSMEEFNKLPKNYNMPYSKIESLDKNTIVRTLVNHNFIWLIIMDLEIMVLCMVKKL